MENPYESPPPDPQADKPPLPTARPVWPVYFSMVWMFILFLLLPAISWPRHSPPPPGHFLWLKLVTTAFSLPAIFSLIVLPKLGWKLLTAPLAVLLAFIQWTAWIHLP